MNAARTTALMGLVLTSMLSLGCGDDGPGRLSTGVDGNKPLGMATPAEADQICKRTQTWIAKAVAEDKQRQLACRIGGLFAAGAASGLGGGGAGAGTTDAQLQATCQMAHDQCMMAAPTAPTTPAMCQSFPPGCTATVAEYEACLNDIPPSVDMTLASLPTCDRVTRLGLLGLLSVVNNIPPTCRTFQMKCSAVGIPGIPGMPAGS